VHTGVDIGEANEAFASGSPLFRDAVRPLLRVSHLVFALFVKKLMNYS